MIFFFLCVGCDYFYFTFEVFVSLCGFFFVLFLFFLAVFYSFQFTDYYSFLVVFVGGSCSSYAAESLLFQALLAGRLS